MIPTVALIIAAIDAFLGALLLSDVIKYQHATDDQLSAFDSIVHMLNIAMPPLLIAVPLSLSIARLRYSKYVPYLQYGAAWLLFAKGASYIMMSFVIVNESMIGTFLFVDGIVYAFISALCYRGYRILRRVLA